MHALLVAAVSGGRDDRGKDSPKGAVVLGVIREGSGLRPVETEGAGASRNCCHEAASRESVVQDQALDPGRRDRCVRANGEGGGGAVWRWR